MAFCVSGQLLSAVAFAPLLIARLPRRRTSTASIPPPVSTESTPRTSQPPPPSAVASESNPIVAPPAPTTERCTGPACKQKTLALPNATNLPRLKWTRKEKQILAAATTAGAAAAFNSGGDGGGGVGGGGSAGGGRGGGGNIWDWLLSLQSIAAEEAHQEWDSHGLPADITVQLNRLSGVRRYKVSEVLFFDRRTRTTVSGAEDSFFDPVSLRPGGVYTRSQLVTELENMASGGMFDKVDLAGKTKPDGTLALTVSFTEAMYESANAVRCINVGLMPLAKPMEADADMTDREKMQYYRQLERDYKKRMNGARQCMLPVPVQRDLLKMLRGQGRVSARLLQKILNRVQKWYHDEGYAFAGVAAGRLNSKEVVVEVVEGDITKLDIQFLDKLGNVCEGNTQPAVVHRMLPKQLRPGHVFNIEAVRQALRQLQSLALFSSMEVNPFPDENNEGGIIVEVKLKEMEHNSSNLDTQWNIVPGRLGGLTLESIQPGGTISFEHRNIKGLNRSIAGALSCSNLLNPQDGLDFKFEYVHPYVDGVHNPRDRTFNVSCFNSRKLSPVFTGGPELDEVPPVWIDRMGIKATLTECLTQLSKLTYGLVVEEIKTRDETNSIISHGSRALPSDTPGMDGPPTTLSSSGIDRMAFVQANITRDDTKFVNGAVVGARDVFQLDQGLGIGSNFPFFNRHQLALTRFVQLKPAEEGAGKPPPPVLVLHGRYGGCVGDLPSYDAFALGGPYSVRGYNMGELGACRNILELATEVRIPIKNTYVYAFAEHGNDLGSSKDVKGNPTEFFRRAGHGSSYGVGVRIQAARAEYVVDHNSSTGAVSLRFGDRF